MIHDVYRFEYGIPEKQLKEKIIDFAEKKGFLLYKPLVTTIKADIFLKTKIFNLFLLVNVLPSKKKDKVIIEYNFRCKGLKCLDFFGASRKGKETIEWINENLKRIEHQNKK